MVETVSTSAQSVDFPQSSTSSIPYANTIHNGDSTSINNLDHPYFAADANKTSDESLYYAGGGRIGSIPTAFISSNLGLAVYVSSGNLTCTSDAANY